MISLFLFSSFSTLYTFFDLFPILAEKTIYRREKVCYNYIITITNNRDKTREVTVPVL